MVGIVHLVGGCIGKDGASEAGALGTTGNGEEG